MHDRELTPVGRRLAASKYRADTVRMYGLLQKLPVNDTTTCLGNLLTHTVAELDRYIGNRRKSVYVRAALVRNVFERSLITGYVLSSVDPLHDWMGQRIYDEVDVLESVRLLSDAPADTQWINKEIARLKGIASKRAIVVRRYKSTSTYARQLGRDREHRIFYGLYSKFTHPSSWIINEDNSRIEGTDVFQTIFILKTKKYLDEILGNTATYIDSSLKKGAKNRAR